MEVNEQSSPQGNVDIKAKAAFRKPSNDAGNRKYRRRSPVNGSSSSEGSPTREHNYSQVQSRKDPERGADDLRRKDDPRDLDRDFGRSQYGRSDDSYRHFDRVSSRSSRSYHRHDDYHRRDKYVDNDKDYSRSSRTGRDSKSDYYSDHSRRENEYRSRDRPRHVDKYSRDKSDGQGDRSRNKEIDSKEKDILSVRAGSGRRNSNSTSDDFKSGQKDRYEDKDGRDEKMEYRRYAGDYDHSPAYNDSRSHKSETTSRRDSSGYRLKESSWSDLKSSDGEKYSIEEEKNHEDRVKYKERLYKEAEERSEDKKFCSGRDQESSAKKPKLFYPEGSSNNGKDVTKAKGVVDEKQAQESASKMVPEQPLTDSDIDAAKIAAMKAAELVNKNLIGTGYMSAEQKKKLLWGNKKTTATEESANRWDTAIFGDRERQDKFNKLMSLRLHCLWRIVGCEGRCESGKQIRRSQCRAAERAATARFREAVHCWTSSKRWPHCWTRSLITCWLHPCCVHVTVFSSALLYYLVWCFNDAHLLDGISYLRLKFMIMITDILDIICISVHTFLEIKSILVHHPLFPGSPPLHRSGVTLVYLSAYIISMLVYQYSIFVSLLSSF